MAGLDSASAVNGIVACFGTTVVMFPRFFWASETQEMQDMADAGPIVQQTYDRNHRSVGHYFAAGDDIGRGELTSCLITIQQALIISMGKYISDKHRAQEFYPTCIKVRDDTIKALNDQAKRMKALSTSLVTTHHNQLIVAPVDSQIQAFERNREKEEEEEESSYCLSTIEYRYGDIPPFTDGNRPTGAMYCMECSRCCSPSHEKLIRLVVTDVSNRRCVIRYFRISPMFFFQSHISAQQRGHARPNPSWHEGDDSGVRYGCVLCDIDHARDSVWKSNSDYWNHIGNDHSPEDYAQNSHIVEVKAEEQGCDVRWFYDKGSRLLR
ncbi:hypothetical protein B0J11DRAFT_542595 [Dendryphion nanum]|uniref:Uncharacterized protein n=1 Tax=Dendryphion nanum TaxID=256645 RepID=A0A9P9I9B0_9PLEO|nr:hypothetical protein B0J11DRAFT_542595 [Dendryphion nanum]